MKQAGLESEQNSWKTKDLEGKVTAYSLEIERVNSNLKAKVDEAVSWEGKYKQILYENEEVKRRLRELADTNNKLTEYEKNTAILYQ